MARKLTPKQRKFANEFIKTNNAYQSAIKAGYSKAYAKNAGKFLLENIGMANYKFNPNKPGIFQWQSVDDVFLMVVD
ncbi:terminase small subunit [Lactiplantibacillus plantarum]|nr:terminase small subunit [Lactiplantibacillus plantarum]UZM81925.1 terminase small subunit [Lactiplantibacillus argentoratensis]